MKTTSSIGVVALSLAFLFAATGCSDDDVDPKKDQAITSETALIEEAGTEVDQAVKEDTAKEDTGNTGTSLGSCTNTVESIRTCTSYIGSSFAAGIDAMKNGCEGAGGGTWSTGDCDATDAQGYCTVAAGMETETRLYYYDLEQVSLDATKTACEAAGGTWLAL